MLYWLEPLKKHKKIINNNMNKIALIVPARNESKCIRRLLDSIKKQTYNKEFFDTYIIVADSKDPTINIVNQTLPSAITQIVEEQKCKGDALDGCIKNIIKNGREYDYIAIVDADNVLDPKFLEEINNAIASNKDVIVSNRRNLNLEYNNKNINNWISNCSGLTHAFQNELGNWFRSEHDMPLTFCGTGLAIRFSILKNCGGWIFKSVAEDAEFTLFCTANDYTSFYSNDAITYTEEGNSVKGDIIRRVRWVNGFSYAQKKYLKQIKQNAHKNGKFNRKYADTLYSLIPVIALIVETFVFSIACMVVFIVSLARQQVLWRALIWGVSILAILYFFMIMYTLFGLLACKKYNKMSFLQKISVLFLNPIYCGLYAIVYFKALASKKDKNTWIPTKRLDY